MVHKINKITPLLNSRLQCLSGQPDQESEKNKTLIVSPYKYLEGIQILTELLSEVEDRFIGKGSGQVFPILDGIQLWLDKISSRHRKHSSKSFLIKKEFGGSRTTKPDASQGKRDDDNDCLIMEKNGSLILFPLDLIINFLLTVLQINH